MSIPPAYLDELRARTTLSGLLGREIKLTKAGNEFKACCPFHNEKSASFYVNDDKGFYHCFGCSAHGDAIKWLTDRKGMTFIDAVRELSAAAGLEMPANDPRAREEADRRAPLLDALDRAARLYAQHRDARAPARYIDQRQIPPAIAERFGIGYAPDGAFLQSQMRDVAAPTLVEAGLLIEPDDDRRDRTPYDRFRNRLMFPIHDARGRVVGFGGRLLGDGNPKYLNSPDTPVFDKGRLLFNHHRAAAASRQTSRLLVVEGYMDVIGLARAGIDDVVAPNGTAVTPHQLGLMWRLAPEPVMMLDGDAAGARAMIKAALRALPGLAPDRSLRFAALPAGQDPDDLVRSGGAAAIDKVLDAAIGLAELLWRHESANSRLAEPEGRAGLKQRLMEHVQVIEHAGVRDQYREEFRQRFDSLFAKPARDAPSGGARRSNQPRGKWKPRELPPSAGTRAVATSGIDKQMRLAVLAGLLRYPDVLAGHVERLFGIKLEGRYQQLLDALIDEHLAGGLTADGVPAWLERHGFAGAPDALRIAVRLPFDFLQTSPGPDARDQLLDALYAATS